MKYNKLIKSAIIMVTVGVIMGSSVVIYNQHCKIEDLNNTKDSLTDELELIEENNSDLIDELALLTKTKTSLNKDLVLAEEAVLLQQEVNEELYDTIEKTDKSIKKLKKDNKAIKKKLDEVVEKLNTYENYKYVLYDESGNRTDVTYDQIKLGEKLMKEKGLDPKLLFNIIMVESRGNSSDTNKYSGAAGYGQFIAETGEFVYEKLMKSGEYNHSTTPYNGTINIKMMATYLSYLYEKYDGNSQKVIKEYCGGDNVFTAKYMNWVSSWTPNSYVFGIKNK